MRNLTRIVCGLFLLPVSALAAPPTTAPAPRPDAQVVIDGFAKACDQSTTLNAAQKKSMADVLSAQAKDPERRADVLTNALAAAHPAFAAALAALGEERNAQAFAAFEKLAAAPDPYLAAHARYFQARALVLDDKFEQALPILTDLQAKSTDRTLYGGDMLFLQAVCQARLLQRKEAVRTLVEFIKTSTDAPERVVVGAMQLIEQLKAVQDGSLSDVEDRMGFSRRRLTQEDSGKQTQTEQAKIIALLDKLIEEAEKKDKGGGGGGSPGGGSSRSASRNRPSSPRQQSVLPEGQGSVGDLHGVNRGKAEDTWGKLKEHERQEVLNALKTRFPDRYRELVEQYYKSLQESKE